MTGKCLSRKRSIPSNSMYDCNYFFPSYFLKLISLVYNKAYSFSIKPENDSNLIICGNCRTSLKKRFRY